MGFDRLKFSKNWNSATDFPTLETSETQVRADMQLLHDESKNALNALMEALEKGGSDALVRFGSEEVRYIRMNDSGGLEVSSNGVNYSIVSTGSAGGAAPATHAAQHKTGGTDPIKPADIGAQPAVTGAATTITGSNLTANRALVSNSSGKVAVSAVTATELGYLDGVTSGIQNQLNGKAASGHTHTASDVGAVASTDVQYKIYDNLADIGLTAGSETIESIFAAMPNYSVLRYIGTSAHNASIYPNTSPYGQVEFVKTNSTYGHATFFADVASNSNRGVYELHYNGGNIYGWSKVYTEENKPAPADIGAIASGSAGWVKTLNIGESSSSDTYFYIGDDGGLWIRYLDTDTNAHAWTSVNRLVKSFLPCDGSAAMTGNSLTIAPTGNSNMGGITVNSNNVAFRHSNSQSDWLNYRQLMLYSAKDTAVSNCLRLYNVVNGTADPHYCILHTGNVTAGTTDLTAGTSALATGAIYQVYE